ncbi:MAG: hypothetical protein M0R68_11270, partial [Bacteroidetes bacterium]|nr:hypothetical protein [Bacteroidota bacterium]
TVMLENEKQLNKKKIYIIVVNKNMTASIDTRINLQGVLAQKVKAWFLVGDSVSASNEYHPENVRVYKHNLGKVENGFVVEFPPHSMTALEIE